MTRLRTRNQNSIISEIDSSDKSNDISTLRQITHKKVSGGDIKINNFIGDHECSNMAPSLFAENGTSMIADDAMVLTLK